MPDAYTARSDAELIAWASDYGMIPERLAKDPDMYVTMTQLAGRLDAANAANVLLRAGAPAASGSGTITIPRPHVESGPTHLSQDVADATYLRNAVSNINYQDKGVKFWGSSVTATIVKLLQDSADAVEALTPSTEGGE